GVFSALRSRRLAGNPPRRPAPRRRQRARLHHLVAAPPLPRPARAARTGWQFLQHGLACERMTLSELGWNEGFAREFEPFHSHGWKPARLIRDHKIAYGALFLKPDGRLDECEAVMCGKVYHDAET